VPRGGVDHRDGNLPGAEGANLGAPERLGGFGARGFVPRGGIEAPVRQGTLPLVVRGLRRLIVVVVVVLVAVTAVTAVTLGALGDGSEVDAFAAGRAGGALGAVRELHVRERGSLRVRRVRGVIRRVRTHRVERGVIRQTAVRVQTAVAAVRRSVLRERGERTLARAASHAVRNGRNGRDTSSPPLVD